MMSTLQERRKKGTDRVHIEVVERARRDNPPHSGNRQHEEIRRALPLGGRGNVVGFRGATHWLPDEQGKHGADKTWNRSDVEREAPTKPMFDQAAAQKVQGDTE